MMERSSKPETVPFIVFEGEIARQERHIKRLWIALIIAVILMFVSNAAWLWSWMQYDYVSEDTEIVTTVDSEGDGIANYTGNDGGVNIGKGYSQKDYADAKQDAPEQ